MEIRKLETLNKGDYYNRHLEVINPFLPIKLTPKEIEVLAAFMSLEGELGNDRFGTTARKVVMERIGISPGGLGNYLKSLKSKGFVYKDYGALHVAKIVQPNPKEQTYQFKIVKI